MDVRKYNVLLFVEIVAFLKLNFSKYYMDTSSFHMIVRCHIYDIIGNV
jgi:hypothetical protein